MLNLVVNWTEVLFSNWIQTALVSTLGIEIRNRFHRIAETQEIDILLSVTLLTLLLSFLLAKVLLFLYPFMNNEDNHW